MSAFLWKEKEICLGERVIIQTGKENGIYGDHVEYVEENVWKWTRTFRITEDRENWKDFTMEMILLDEVEFYMFPCINYNGNAWGNGSEPKGLSDGEKPWCFAGHRSGIPAGMFAQTKNAAIGIFAGLDNPVGSSAEMEQVKGKGFCMRLRFPEQESPRVYCARDRYEEEAYRESVWIQGGKIAFSAWLVLKEPEESFDYAMFLNKAWRICDEKEYLPQMTDRKVWSLGMDFVNNRLYFEENHFAGFCMGLTWNKEKWEPKKDYLEIGWVGQNASLAVSLLYEYAMNDDEEALRRGLAVLDCWNEQAVLPNGLFRCRFDRIEKWGDDVGNKEERNDAANLYSAVTELLEAYHLLKTLGIEREAYRRTALGICAFAAEHQQENGSFAKAWYNDGTISDAEGTIGCYLAEALCIGFRECKRKEFLDAAAAGFDCYYKEFEQYGYTTAGALDTYCVDKESAVPLCRCALELFEITQEKEYLRKAEKISAYLATWQYHYNVFYGSHTLLGQMGYKTRGGTAVSVQHHHIDCYGLELCRAWEKLSAYTENGIWRERAEAIWLNSLQNISDGRTVIKGQRRPRGSQDEGILQTRWHTKKGEYFGVSEWLVAWNTAFRLKLLRKDFLIKSREKSKDEKRIS